MMVISYNRRRIYVNIQAMKNATKTAVFCAINALSVAACLVGLLFIFGTVGALENGGITISEGLLQVFCGCLMLGGTYLIRRGLLKV